MNRGTSVLRRKTRLAPMSDKTKEQAPGRRACVAAVIARDGGCVFWRYVTEATKLGTPEWLSVADVTVMSECWGDLTAHESAHRRNSDATNPDDCICLCTFHNNWLEDHPALGYATGLLEKGNGPLR